MCTRGALQRVAWSAILYADLVQPQVADRRSRLSKPRPSPATQTQYRYEGIALLRVVRGGHYPFSRLPKPVSPTL